MKSFRIIGALLIALGCNGHAWAQADDVHVPAELQDWVPWVLHGDEFRNCPFFSNREPESPDDFICADYAKTFHFAPPLYSCSGDEHRGFATTRRLISGR